MPEPFAKVQQLDVAAYTIPTDSPESDGTFAWDSTTIVVVHAHGADRTGVGYTYGPAAVAGLIDGSLRELACGADVLAPQETWRRMRASLRNSGQQGVGALALSAVDLALHDLRARALGVPLARALGGFRDRVEIYGSGGFTTYGPDRVAEQLSGWVEQGIKRVKIKVGRDPAQDPARLAAAREAIGEEIGLMVDANGAFTPVQALGSAALYDAYGVDYFEEPVSSDDLPGLHSVRAASPPGIAIASGEYNWSVFDARRMLEAEAVDILQADVTRCGGLTELVRIDGLCAAYNRPFSCHCAPAITAHAGCSLERLVHLEYFHDHVRIEHLLFDGTLSPAGGALVPDLDRPGNGLELRHQDARRYQTWP